MVARDLVGRPTRPLGRPSSTCFQYAFVGAS